HYIERRFYRIGSARDHREVSYEVRYNQGCMISQDLLDILVCPVCKKPVTLNAGDKNLKCGECRRVYPIQDDIPIMLVDAATIDAACRDPARSRSQPPDYNIRQSWVVFRLETTFIVILTTHTLVIFPLAFGNKLPR